MPETSRAGKARFWTGQIALNVIANLIIWAGERSLQLYQDADDVARLHLLFAATVIASLMAIAAIPLLPEDKLVGDPGTITAPFVVWSE